MGARPVRAQQKSSSQIQVLANLSPLQRWNSSQQTLQDLIIYLQSYSNINICRETLLQFLLSITSREKYQNYLIGIVDFLRSQKSIKKYESKQRKNLISLLNHKLKNSFFICQDFKQNVINQQLKPYQKLKFLYEYYSQTQQLLQKAIFFNYPTIFIQFPKFITNLIQSQIYIQNEQHFLRLIISQNKIEQIKEYYEQIIIHENDRQYERILQQIKIIQDIKLIYLNIIQQLIKYDYTDICSKIYKNMKYKGYYFIQQQLQYFLKIEIYNIFLYQFNKLSLKFNQIKQMSINQILHYFYTNQQLQQTSYLIQCFQIYDHPHHQWQSYIFNYIFSKLSHISIMIRLLKLNYIKFNKNISDKLLNKIKISHCQIGKYSQQLINLSQYLPSNLQQNYYKLIKLIQIYHIFQINSQIQSLYHLSFINWQHLNQHNIINIKQTGTLFIKNIIINYLSSFNIKLKSIKIYQEIFIFNTIFNIVKFIQSINQIYFHNIINNTAMHQIIFQQLINQSHYPEIKALMTEQRKIQFDIESQIIQMIISDHIITLLTTSKKIKQIEQTIKLLFNILNIYPQNNNSSHYLLAHYNYLKYIQQKGIKLPKQRKQNIIIDNLYYIVNEYTNKIQQIDFNYLYIQQSSIKIHYNNKSQFIPIITDQFLKFKIYLCNQAYSIRKFKYGSDIIQQVAKYQPPWIATQLIKIIRQNNINIDYNFISMTFNFCARGQDLQYILNIYKQKQKQKQNKISFLNFKNWSSLLQNDKYLILNNQLVINQQLYINIVSQFTFNQGQEIKKIHYLFFHLLTIQPEQSFQYAINYNMSVIFIINLILQSIKKGAIHPYNILKYLIKYLYFQYQKQQYNILYINYKSYKSITLQTIINYQYHNKNTYTYNNLQKMIKNYHIYTSITTQFIQLYIHNTIIYKFIYQETFRKKILVDLRQQPMSKNNSKILKILCNKVGIDIIQLSIYNLITQVNSKDNIDDQCWNIVQKLIHWTDNQSIAYQIIQKLSRKIASLQTFVNIIDYLRQSQPIYKIIITQYHLQILQSLAAVEEQNNLFGIIPQNYFQKQIGVYNYKNKGILSQTHRRILRQSGCVQNIFVISKALYFMYGCSQQIQKIILGQFSLQQDDSQQFEQLRKKIKSDFY